jgi:hypothetical protein
MQRTISPSTSRPRAQAATAHPRRARLRAQPLRSAPVAAPQGSKIERLGRYGAADGRPREVIAAHGPGASVLLVDRDALTLGDRRLVAQLAADEPTSNAALVCARYLEDPSRGRCRRVTSRDLEVDPYAAPEHVERATGGSPVSEVVDRDGRDVYRLELVPLRAISELRWRRQPRSDRSQARAVSLREAIGASESYEPALALTLAGLARHRADPQISLAVLRAELGRLRASPIVLNRKLREAVLAAIERDGLSVSEIALRCGRVKRDRKGNISGETSWLARRLGLAAESGAARPTPWVHSDVLALIARSGLGLSPREVELG